MRRNLTLGLTFVVIIAALLAVAAARRPKPPAPTTQAIWKQSGVPVETAAVTRGDMTENMQVTGDLDALNNAVISPKASGRLMSVLVREGDRVARGQVVAVLDQSDATSALQTAEAGLESARARLAQAITGSEVTKTQTQTAIQQAQANLTAARAKLAVTQKPTRSQERMVAEHRVSSAKANLDRAEADYQRNDRLLKDGAISRASFDVVKAEYVVAQSDYQSAKEQLGLIDEGGRREDISSAQAGVASAEGQVREAKANAAQTRVKENDVQAARAAVAQAQAAADTARRQLGDTAIKAPIAGVVSARSADPGQIVSPGQVLARVVDLSSVYLKGDIPETYLARVAKGQPVTVRIEALAGQSFQGAVTEVYPSGSTSNRNFSVRISIPRVSPAVRPGMSASGEVRLGEKRGVLLVPKDAVDDREGTQTVFTVKGDRTAGRHVVSVVRTDARNAELAEPVDLELGDRVVTQGRKNLQDGSKVELQDHKEAEHVAH